MDRLNAGDRIARHGYVFVVYRNDKTSKLRLHVEHGGKKTWTEQPILASSGVALFDFPERFPSKVRSTATRLLRQIRAQEQEA